MANAEYALSGWSGRFLSLLRFVAGFLFLWHGTQKLLGFPPAQQPGGGGGGGGLPPLMMVAGSLELVGGILLIFGLFTRPVAFILSGLMAVAYFMAHASASFPGFLPIVNRGELAVLYSFVFLYLAAAGGGPWSLDAILRRRG